MVSFTKNDAKNLGAFHAVEWDEWTMTLLGDIPPDEKFYYWINCFGQIELARMRFDIKDHFYPHTKNIKKKFIIGWFELKNRD